MLTKMSKLNRLMVENHFYPLALASALALGLLAGRAWYSAEPRWFRFLAWNLFLAWVPYFWSLWALSMHRRRPGRWWLLLLPAAAWLLFFPNAPYLVTDLIHLRAYPPVPLWYDAIMLMSFAWAGCFLALVSLNMMHQIARHYAGRTLSWVIVMAVLGLCGLGIYMGRFLRWNSWDLILYPYDVLSDIGQRLLNPFSHLQAYGVTLLFAAFLLVSYGMFVSIKAHAEK
jgi:uncharacterized membrane protein